MRGLGFDTGLIQRVTGKMFPSASEITNAEVVIQLYNKILGRDPNPLSGQPDWHWNLLNQGLMNLKQVAEDLYGSQEYKMKHAGQPAPPAVVTQTTTETKEAVPTYVPKDNTLIYAGVGILGLGLFTGFFRKIFRRRG